MSNMAETNDHQRTTGGTNLPWTSLFDVPCCALYANLSQSILPGDNENPPIENLIQDEIDSSHESEKEAEETTKEHDEALGWILDASARGVAIMGTAVFVSSDLLRLAKEAAGCVDSEEECTERIYGMRPSSILTNIVLMVGLLSAFTMPLIGSIIDHTNHRRAIGSISAASMSFTILFQMLIMENHWFIASMLQIIIAFSYTVHLCAVYAYLPELTEDTNKLSQYTTRFSAAQYTSSVVFLLVMVGVISNVNGNGKLRSVLLSQSLVFTVCFLFFGYAWTRLFQPRPASQKVPANSSLVSAGFQKVYKTSQTILLHHSAIKWFLVSAAFTEAATTSFSTIAITYMTEVLGFSPRENGLAILILLLFGVPGTRIAAWLTKLLNPIRSLQINLIFWVCSIGLAYFFLNQVGQQTMAYMFAMAWGIAIGWVYPTEKTLYITIIPRGQEAELMGTYICCCQILSWLPPLVFSVMNEMGFSMQMGLLSLSFYFAVSFFVLFFVGDYDEAVLHAKAIDEGGIPFTISPKEDVAAAIGACYEQMIEESVSYERCDSDIRFSL